MVEKRFMKTVSTLALCWALTNGALATDPDHQEGEKEVPQVQRQNIPQSQGQNLTQVRELRRHFFKGKLEITSENYETLLASSHTHEAAFNAYDKGVVIKNWKTSLGFDPLIDLLLSFSHIKSFKVGINWDKDEDATELISRAVQFYEDLEDLDISDCRIKDPDMSVIMESIPTPDKLNVLDVRRNALNEETLKMLQGYFKNIKEFRSDLSVSSPAGGPLEVEKEKARAALAELERKAEEGKVETALALRGAQIRRDVAEEHARNLQAQLREGLEGKDGIIAQIQRGIEEERARARAVEEENALVIQALGEELQALKEAADPRARALAKLQRKAEEERAVELQLQREAEEKRAVESAIYQRFLKGVLVYRPREGSEVGRIDLPISALQNPLEGTFDLSQCGGLGQYLSISTGYRKGKKAENENKLEIWLVPRFLIEKELATTAAHFQGVYGGWKDTAPVGIFWTWGAAASLSEYDCLITENMDHISNNNISYKWRFSRGTESSAFGHYNQKASGIHFSTNFHFYFVN